MIIFVEIKTIIMKKRSLFGVSLLLGLIFINSGLNKFFNYMPMPKDMPEHMMKLMGAIKDIGWLFPLVAVAEIVGGALFITNKFRALGAIIIFPVLAGILLTHIFVAPSGLPMAFVLWGIELWVIIENREKYLPMIK